MNGGAALHELPRRPVPVILDVDTGVDDALALLYAAMSPSIDLRAVTCVAGNVDVTTATRNTLAVLDTAGRSDVPVARGAGHPLLTRHRPAPHVHGVDGLAGVPVASSGPDPADLPDAMKVFQETLLGSPEKVTIVALAPQTNLALMFLAHPELLDRVERVVMMAGAVSVPGNATPAAEFNIWHDPEAAAIVVDTGVPVSMYGLDVFYSVRAGARQVAQLREHAGREATLAADLLAAHASLTGSSDVGLGDAGAVVVAGRPDLCTSECLPLQVDISHGLGRGQTIVDRRRPYFGPSPHDRDGDPRDVFGDPRDVDCVLSLDAPGVLDDFLAALVSRGRG